MEPLYIIENDLSHKERTEIIRVLIGRAYFLFLLASGAVICYNYYLITSNQAASEDMKKTVTLFALMAVWALIPVVGAFVWGLVSKVKHIKVEVYGDRLLVETNVNKREITPHQMGYVMERESYIKVGTLKNGVILNKNHVTKGDGDTLAKFLRDMDK